MRRRSGAPSAAATTSCWLGICWNLVPIPNTASGPRHSPGDIEAIRLLVSHGATVDALHEDGTPFLGAIKISHFEEAELFLELGADVDMKDSSGLTALHLLLKKGSDAAHVAMLIRHGARGDIPDQSGKTAIEILRRKKDPAFRRMAEALAAR